jgi:hypothetical protein
VSSELSSDPEFLRRVCLDVTGSLPPPQRVREFIDDKNPQKRDRLVEILLNSPEYVDYWSFRFGDLLRATYVTSNNTKATGVPNWIANSIATNKLTTRWRGAHRGAGYGARPEALLYLELTTPSVLMPADPAFYGLVSSALNVTATRSKHGARISIGGWRLSLLATRR